MTLNRGHVHDGQRETNGQDHVFNVYHLKLISFNESF
jgi:hypothetical protein